MAPLHLSHRQEKTVAPTSKIIKKILFGTALFSLLSVSAIAHDFDISNPELLQIELNDTILVRPPPMVNPPTNQYIVDNTSTQKSTNLSATINSQTDGINFLGLFLTLAGFIIGLGAVTVIDLHGFMARKSPYWTDATIRTHKITKPLIWIGMFSAIIGEIILYRNSQITSAIATQAIIAAILLLNGCFLTFKISPFLLKLEKEKREKKILPKKLQSKIMISFLISFFGWWSELALLSLYLISKIHE